MQLNAQDMDATSPAWDEFVAIYEEAFPAGERIDIDTLAAMVCKTPGNEAGKVDGAHLTGFFDQDLLRGFALWVEAEQLTYLAFLAVNARARSGGVGSAILGWLRDHRPNVPLIAEVERLDPQADNASQREQRQAFYRRNGLEATGWQDSDEHAVYDIFSTEPKLDVDAVRAAVQQVFGVDEELQIWQV